MGKPEAQRRWECTCALLVGKVLARAGAEPGALTVLAGGSSLRGMLDPLRPVSAALLLVGAGEEIGHTRACGDTFRLSLLSERLLKANGGSFPRATSHFFKILSSRWNRSAFYCKDSRFPNPSLERTTPTAGSIPGAVTAQAQGQPTGKAEKPRPDSVECVNQ